MVLVPESELVTLPDDVDEVLSARYVLSAEADISSIVQFEAQLNELLEIMFLSPVIEKPLKLVLEVVR